MLAKEDDMEEEGEQRENKAEERKPRGGESQKEEGGTKWGDREEEEVWNHRRFHFTPSLH